MGTNKKLCCNDLLARRYKLQPVMDSIYIAEGQNLKFGSVVDCNGFLCGSTHLEPYAILYEDCDTTNGAQEANVLIMGEFNIEKLVFGADATGDVLDKIVFYAKKNGIIIRPYDYAPSFTPPEVSNIENVIPEGTSQTNPLMNAEETQRKIDDSIHEVTLDPSKVALGNVHNLDVVTSFAADAKILVDSETNGPGAMPKDNLFDIITNYALAKGIKPVGSVNSLVGSAPYNNLDTFPNNELALVTTNYASVSNKPTSEQFSVLTMSNSSTSSVKMQILNTQSNQTYIRSKFGGSWGSWAKIGIDNPIVGAGSKGTATAPYDDLNTFPNNEVVINTATYSNVSNKPTDEAFNVATISNSSSSTAKFQILSTQSNKLFVRSAYSGTWGRWSRIDSDTEFVGNPLMCYDNMLFIGDSLTWSAVYIDNDSSHCRQAKKTYPQMMAHICGATQDTLATAGDSASQSWDRYNASLTSKTNALAVIYLGTNAGLTDTLDTDAPEADPYTEWADTDTGCYAKYVAKLQELGYKILLVKPWASSGTTLPDTKKVIGEIAERFGCAVVQAPVNSEYKYHYYPDLSGRNDVHYNDLGYSWFASALVEAVASLPEVGSSNSLKYIIPD